MIGEDITRMNKRSVSPQEPLPQPGSTELAPASLDTCRKWCSLQEVSALSGGCGQGLYGPAATLRQSTPASTRPAPNFALWCLG